MNTLLPSFRTPSDLLRESLKSPLEVKESLLKFNTFNYSPEFIITNYVNPCEEDPSICADDYCRCGYYEAVPARVLAVPMALSLACELMKPSVAQEVASDAGVMKTIAPAMLLEDFEKYRHATTLMPKRHVLGGLFLSLLTEGGWTLEENWTVEGVGDWYGEEFGKITSNRSFEDYWPLLERELNKP